MCIISGYVRLGSTIFCIYFKMTEEKPALRKPEFVKVKDILRGRSGYNVYVKVLKVEPKDVETKDGQKIPMVHAVVADETGAAAAFFKGEHAKLVTEGNVIAIRNGVKKIIKGHISLEVDIFGRVTPETVEITPVETPNISDEEIKIEPRKNAGRRDFKTNRGNRGVRGEGRRRGEGQN